MFGRLSQYAASILPYNINTKLNIANEDPIEFSNLPSEEIESAPDSSDSIDGELGVGVFRAYKYESLEGRDGYERFDLFACMRLMKEVESTVRASRVMQKERLLKPAAAALIPSLKVCIQFPKWTNHLNLIVILKKNEKKT